jgi:hypothetical protein
LPTNPLAATVSGTGNQAIVTPNGSNTFGEVTLTATVNDNCLRNNIATIVLLIGGSYGNDFTINPSSSGGCYGLFEMFDLQAFPVNTQNNYTVNYQWSYLKESTTEPTVWTNLPYDYSSCTVSFYEEGTYQLRLITTDVCGLQHTAIKYVTISSSCGGGGFFRITASPNPATNDLYVSIDNEKQEVKDNTASLSTIQMNLYDLFTSQIVRQWKLPNNQKQYHLNVN